MADFAKLFEGPTHGQTLVKLDRSLESGDPEVRVYVSPDGFGVCSSALVFHDTEEGWDAAECAFALLDAEGALIMAREVFKGAKLCL